jgi:hypothetical protein
LDAFDKSNYNKSEDSRMLNILEFERNKMGTLEQKHENVSNIFNNKIEIFSFPGLNQNEKSINNDNKIELGMKTVNEIRLETKSVFCIYCLRSAVKPIILSSCKHELCMECAKEYISITDYLKNYDINHIKCPKCKKKSYIKDKINFEGNLDYTWFPSKSKGNFF